MSLHFWGSLACKIEKAKDPNCDAYHLRVSIFALKKCCSEAAVSRKERHTCGQALKVELHRFVEVDGRRHGNRMSMHALLELPSASGRSWSWALQPGSRRASKSSKRWQR